MLDVLVAGAGPAGALAACRLARAGARVLIVDRAAFPRDKLCGDTLNPGAVRLLADAGLLGGPLSGALRLHGMRLTGPRTSVVARYGPGVHGLAIRRVDLDAWLVEEAVRAGAQFESRIAVRRPLVDEGGGRTVVRGLVLAQAGTSREMRMPATMTIAADGRHSAVGRALGLVGRDARPGRWAYGAYASDVSGMSDVGEMHVRGGWYLGLAPVPNGLVNICVVKPRSSAAGRPIDVIRRAIAADPEMAARFAGARLDTNVRVLGPLASVVRAVGVPGVLMAGDASGFVDPMTGDGLHLAMRSALLAADEAIRALEHGDLAAAPDRLATTRRLAFGRKLRFNRAVRRLVDSPAAVAAADVGARIWPGALSHAVRYAGDVA